jgi:hypothetical protein
MPKDRCGHSAAVPAMWPRAISNSHLAFAQGVGRSRNQVAVRGRKLRGGGLRERSPKFKDTLDRRIPRLALGQRLQVLEGETRALWRALERIDGT